MTKCWWPVNSVPMNSLVAIYIRSIYSILYHIVLFNSSRKLFGCLQTPFLEMKNMIRPPPSPINHGEGESLSEWFCHMNSTACQSECSSLSIPFGEMSLSYMDDVSETSSNYQHAPSKDDQDNGSQAQYSSFRGKSLFHIFEC